MEMHSEYVQCGERYPDMPIPLTVAEAISWLDRGEQVQLLCEASPWPATFASEALTRQFQQRSFAGMSATLHSRVAMVPVGNVTGAYANQSHGVSDDTAERPSSGGHSTPWDVGPFVAYMRGIPVARDDVAILRRLAIALDITHTALVNEAVLIFSPPSDDLLSAFAFAIAAESLDELPTQWRFVTDQPHTVANIARSGGIAVHPSRVADAAFEHVNLGSNPIFGVGVAGVPSWP